jgi:alkaline phosphatase
MTIGFAGTLSSCFVGMIKHQKMSYLEFNKKIADYKKNHSLADARFEDILPLIKEAFGMYALGAEEKAALEKVVLAGQEPDASPEVKDAAGQAAATLKSGLVLTDLELMVLREAFQQSLHGEKKQAKMTTPILYATRLTVRVPLFK